MPKEVVYTGLQLVDAPDRGEYAASEIYPGDWNVSAPYQRGIIVRWDKGNAFVELGVSKILLADHIEKEPHYTQGLSRQQINDLIRNLRKARDGAFGRDE